MILEKIDLYKYFGLKRKKGALGYLNTYIAENSPELNLKRTRPAMIVCPGGGYQMLSDREKEPVAIKFLEKGYSSFTLEYSIKTLGFPTQLIEACMAVAYVREKAAQYFVDKDHVAVIGFSAGAHLAGTIATLYEDDAVKKALKDYAASVRPDAVILAYPVVTSDPKFWHSGSIETVAMGKKSLIQKLSLEKRVTGESVPAFIWHTKEDGAVPVFNSICLASAYAEHGVPFELHVFERGPHGLSLANLETAPNGQNKYCNPNVAVWVDLADNWLKSRGFAIN